MVLFGVDICEMSLLYFLRMTKKKNNKINYDSTNDDQF